MAICGGTADCDNADGDGDADDIVDASRAKRTVHAVHKASFGALQVSSKTLKKKKKKRQRYSPNEPIWVHLGWALEG